MEEPIYCSVCDDVKCVDDFTPSQIKRKDKKCKICVKAENKAYKEKHKKELAIKQKIWVENNREKVAATKKEYKKKNKVIISEKRKEYDTRRADKRHTDYENNVNGIKDKAIVSSKKSYQKHREARKQEYQENQEYYIEKQRKYKENNKEKVAESRQKSYIKNKDKINSVDGAKARWHKEQYENDPCYKLRNLVSNAIGGALRKNQSSKRGQSVMQYLPYTIEELKAYIESLWEPWMTWEDHGEYRIGGEKKWHIDHIIPQVMLPYDSMDHPNFLKCWALENLRPLEAVANMKRGKRML